MLVANPCMNMPPAHAAGEDIVEAAGKMGVLDRLLSKLKARGHRVTLFSQYNRMLDIIEDYLLMRGYRWVVARALGCLCLAVGRTCQYGLLSQCHGPAFQSFGLC